MKTITGIVTNVLHERGYGFIRDENNEDRFFHARDVSGRFVHIQPNTRVECVPVEDTRFFKKNGLRAENVRVAA